MSNKFDRQLKELLASDVEQEVDELQDEDDYHELTPVVFDKKASQIELQDNPDLEEDYNFARSNYYGLIGRTNSAVDLALKIAAMSEHPRAMEVAATLMKTSADVTKDLLALQKSINNSSESLTVKPKGTLIQNNYYGDKNSNEIEAELDEMDDQED